MIYVAQKQLKVWNRAVCYEWWAVDTDTGSTTKETSGRRMGAWSRFRRSRQRPMTTQITKTLLMFSVLRLNRATWVRLLLKSARLMHFLRALKGLLLMVVMTCRTPHLYQTTLHRQRRTRGGRLRTRDREDASWVFKTAMSPVPAPQQEVGLDGDGHCSYGFKLSSEK